ncbi:MAG: hypothetical protein J7L62_03875 [Candidatus Aminicenantes bacterium]|nr:hypothetical protein [Candidatus Aminicenantes bacterium]
MLKKAHKKAKISGKLMSFLWKNKLWWLVTFIIILLLFGIIMIVAESSVLGPFIYTIF